MTALPVHGKRVAQPERQMLRCYNCKIIEQQECDDEEIPLIPPHPRDTIDHAPFLLFMEVLMSFILT